MEKEFKGLQNQLLNFVNELDRMAYEMDLKTEQEQHMVKVTLEKLMVISREMYELNYNMFYADKIKERYEKVVS